MDQGEEHMFGNLSADFSVKGDIGSTQQIHMVAEDLGDFFFQRENRWGLYRIEDVESRFGNIGWCNELGGIAYEIDL